MQNRSRLPEWSASLTQSSTSWWSAPCVAAARIVCRAIAVTAAAFGPVPQTSPITIAQR